MNVTSLRRPAPRPSRPAWRAPGPATVPNWSARPPEHFLRRAAVSPTSRVQCGRARAPTDDAGLFAEETPRAAPPPVFAEEFPRAPPPTRVAATPPPPWSPGTPPPRPPPPPPFVHEGVVEWSPPQPKTPENDDIVWARPRPLPRPAQIPPPRSPLDRLESLAHDSDDASSVASRAADATPALRRDELASPTTMEAVGLLVEHAARLEDEVRRRTGELEDEVSRLRSDGAAQEHGALRGELAELKEAILGAVASKPPDATALEIARLREDVAALRASARLPSEDLGDALAAVTRAAVDKVASMRSGTAVDPDDQHWAPDAAAERPEQVSPAVDQHWAPAAEQTEHASPGPWAPLTTPEGHVYWYHTETHETTWERPAAAAEAVATARALAERDARIAELAERDARIAELEARWNNASASRREPTPDEAAPPTAAPAPVPPPPPPPTGAWAPLTAPTGDVYWYHTETHETTWERPVSAPAVAPAAVPEPGPTPQPVAAPAPVAAPEPAPAPISTVPAPVVAPASTAPVPVAAPTSTVPELVTAPISTAPAPATCPATGGLEAQIELCSALQGFGKLLNGEPDAAAPPRPDDIKLEGLVGNLIGVLKTDAGKRDFERLAAQQAAQDDAAIPRPEPASEFVWTAARPPTPASDASAPATPAVDEPVAPAVPSPDARLRAEAEAQRRNFERQEELRQAEAEVALRKARDLRAENARLREEMERLRRAAARPAPREDATAAAAAPIIAELEARAERLRELEEAAVASAAARAVADAAAAARCDRAATAMDAAAQAASKAAAAAAMPSPRAMAPFAARPDDDAAPVAAPLVPSPEPEAASRSGLRASRSNSSLEEQIASGRRSLRKSPPPSPSPAQKTRKSVESYMAARWRKAESDAPLDAVDGRAPLDAVDGRARRVVAAACPLDGGDSSVGVRLQAYEPPVSESIASSSDDSSSIASVEAELATSAARPRTLLSKARAVNGETRKFSAASPEPAPPRALSPEPAHQTAMSPNKAETRQTADDEPSAAARLFAPVAASVASSPVSVAGSTVKRASDEDPVALAAAQTRLAASEAELEGLLAALAETRRAVAETRRAVDDVE